MCCVGVTLLMLDGDPVCDVEDALLPVLDAGPRRAYQKANSPHYEELLLVCTLGGCVKADCSP